MSWPGEVRRARADDADDVARLAAELAMSFEFSAARFREHYPSLLADDGACLLLAVSGSMSVGYLLGFRHLTFYANGPVGWVEEIVVLDQERGHGVGRLLMGAFEQWATAGGARWSHWPPAGRRRFTARSGTRNGKPRDRRRSRRSGSPAITAITRSCREPLLGSVITKAFILTKGK